MTKAMVIKDTQKARDALQAAGFRWASGDDMNTWGKGYIGSGNVLYVDLEDKEVVCDSDTAKKTHKVVKAADNVFIFMPR